ncbi:MAG: MBL fold metallo-hydrolase [Acidobacteriota bacterium]
MNKPLAGMQLEEIGKDVYACLQEDKGLGYSNSGFINRGGGLVVDTFWDLPHTRELIENYKRVQRQSIKRVVNTHSNGDHCWGNQLFEGAELIGHRRCPELMQRESPQTLQGLRNATGSPDPAIASMAKKLSEWNFEGVELTPPNTLFDERLDLNLDGLPVQLIYVGPAHTSGDVIVHLPEQRIVFAGDVLFRFCTPIGWDGTFNGWVKALDFISKLEPEVIVPGHGQMCGVEGITEMKEYLLYVLHESRYWFDRGVTIFEAAKKIDLGKYAGWNEPQRIIFNVERAYREFRDLSFDQAEEAISLFRGMYELEMQYNRNG